MHSPPNFIGMEKAGNQYDAIWIYFSFIFGAEIKKGLILIIVSNTILLYILTQKNY